MHATSTAQLLNTVQLSQWSPSYHNSPYHSSRKHNEWKAVWIYRANTAMKRPAIPAAEAPIWTLLAAAAEDAAEAAAEVAELAREAAEETAVIPSLA